MCHHFSHYVLLANRGSRAASGGCSQLHTQLQSPKQVSRMLRACASEQSPMCTPVVKHRTYHTCMQVLDSAKRQAALAGHLVVVPRWSQMPSRCAPRCMCAHAYMYTCTNLCLCDDPSTHTVTRTGLCAPVSTLLYIHVRAHTCKCRGVCCMDGRCHIIPT